MQDKNTIEIKVTYLDHMATSNVSCDWINAALKSCAISDASELNTMLDGFKNQIMQWALMGGGLTGDGPQSAIHALPIWLHRNPLMPRPQACKTYVVAIEPVDGQLIMNIGYDC